MHIKSASLLAVTVKPDQFPITNMPEFAFVGRSNVGKSSLLNCMLNRKKLARISSLPGKTRTINFYKVEDRLLFVDLPGYGYSKISRSESEKWGKMAESYLIGRKQLISVVLLIDIRHKLSLLDLQMYQWLTHYNFDIIIVATKSDKISRGLTQKHISEIRKGLDLESTFPIISFSIESSYGRETLWSFLQKKIIISTT